MGRFHHPDEEWGTFVDVKINAFELLRSELTKRLDLKGSVLRRRSDPISRPQGLVPEPVYPERSRREGSNPIKPRDIGTIVLSSVTDPYQGLEAKYKLTRKCLEVLSDLDYEGKVGILTKSALVLRDINLFKKLKNVSVGLTVTSTGDIISKYLETFASPHQTRIETLKKLHDVVIRTYAFVGPLLPHFVFMKSKMEKLLKQLKRTGVEYIYLEHLNLLPYIRDRLSESLKKDYHEELKKFKLAQTPQYRQELDEILLKLTGELGLPIAHQKPIYHQNKGSWQKLSQKT